MDKTRIDQLNKASDDIFRLKVVVTALIVQMIATLLIVMFTLRC